MGRQICFTADEDLIKQINEMAQKLKRSRSDTIHMLLKVAVKISGTGKLTEAVKPLRTFSSFEEYLNLNPKIKVIYNSTPPEQQAKWKENWKKMGFLRE